MEIKNICATVLIDITFFIFGTVVFALLFHTSLFNNISLLFYRGITLLLVSCFFTLILMIFCRRNIKGSIFTYRDIILLVVLIFCLNLVFFTHLPVTADRSVSVFILGYMNKYQNKGLTVDEITKLLIKKYVNEYGAVGKRLNEQIISGNIILKNGKYKITKQGGFIIGIYSFVASVFNINKKLIYP